MRACVRGGGVGGRWVCVGGWVLTPHAVTCLKGEKCIRESSSQQQNWPGKQQQ